MQVISAAANSRSNISQMAPAVNRIVHHLMVDRIFVVKIRKRFHVSAIERFDPASQYIR